MSGKKEKRSIVPWFSMAEWNQVYKDLYSDDVELQTRGYERLLVWKARVPVLPASIECTLELIQVCLRDHDVSPQIFSGKLPAYVEHDLRLMYSTAIMRFLNHLSSIAQNADETLFNMAKKLYIPEWVVSLRHDTAHGSNLPSLELLRTGSQVALQWLHEHYWKSEAETTSDWIVTEDDCSDLAELVDRWQALKLCALGGIAFLSELPDEELRTYVQEMWGEQGDLPVQSAASIVYRKLLADIKRKKRRDGFKMNELVEVIVTRESFIPPADCMEHVCDSLNVKPKKDCLPPWLFDLWKNLFTVLQKSYSFIPPLVCRLIALVNCETEDMHRRQIAALWVQELCSGLEKGREILERVSQWQQGKRCVIPDKLFKKKTVSSKLKNKKGVEFKLSRKATWKLIKRKLEQDDPGWKHVLCLELSKPPGSICSHSQLKEIVSKPNRFTLLFLPSLLELMVPPVPATAKENLLTLVRIYTTNHRGLGADDRVHTVEELKGLTTEAEFMDVESDIRQLNDEGSSELEVSRIEELVTWTRCEDDEQWAKCPLGLLPWQRDEMPTFDMPKDIMWQLLDPSGVSRKADRDLAALFRKKINWSETVKKKPKRAGRNLRRRGFVKKAFSVASRSR